MMSLNKKLELNMSGCCCSPVAKIKFKARGIMISLGYTAAIAPFLNLIAYVAAGVVEVRQCPVVLTPAYPAPVLAEGWEAQLVVTGLASPRGVAFDSNGALLVVQQGAGVVRITFTDNGGTCLVLNERTTVVSQTDVGFRSDRT